MTRGCLFGIASRGADALLFVLYFVLSHVPAELLHGARLRKLRSRTKLCREVENVLGELKQLEMLAKQTKTPIDPFVSDFIKIFDELYASCSGATRVSKKKVTFDPSALQLAMAKTGSVLLETPLSDRIFLALQAVKNFHP